MGINTKQEGCYAVLKPVTKSHWNENFSTTRTNFSFVLVGFRSSGPKSFVELQLRAQAMMPGHENYYTGLIT